MDPKMREPEVFRHSQVLEACDGDSGFVRELVSQFASSLPPLLAEIESSLASRELRQIETTSHALKSTALTMGADALAAACHGIESLAVRGEFKGIPEAFARTRVEAARLSEVLSDYLRATAA